MVKTPPTPPSPVRIKTHQSCDFGSDHSPNYNPPGACKNHMLTYHEYLACPSWRWPKKRKKLTRADKKARSSKSTRRSPTVGKKKTKREAARKKSTAAEFPSLAALVDALPQGAAKKTASDELTSLLSRVRF